MSEAAFFGAKRGSKKEKEHPIPEPGTAGKKDAAVEAPAPARKAKHERKSPLYTTSADALDRLAKNGIKAKADGSVIYIMGSPGIKLLGAVDFLRRSFIVHIMPRKERN